MNIDLINVHLFNLFPYLTVFFETLYLISLTFFNIIIFSFFIDAHVSPGYLKYVGVLMFCCICFCLRYSDIYMVFTTEGFLEVAIESWPEWDLNPRPLNSVQTLLPTELSGHEFNLLSEPTLYSYSKFISLFSVREVVYKYIYVNNVYISNI